MIKKLTNLISRITALKTLLIGIAAIVVIEIAFNLFMPAFARASGGTILDMAIAYKAEFAYERLNSITAAYDTYFMIRLIDFFFPAVYAFTLSILSCFIYRKKYDELENYRWILAVPFLAAFFDYTENFIIIILYRLLPAEYYAAATVLNIITLLKFGLLSLSALLFITGGFSLIKGGDSMLLMGNKFRGKKKE